MVPPSYSVTLYTDIWFLILSTPLRILGIFVISFLSAIVFTVRYCPRKLLGGTRCFVVMLLIFTTINFLFGIIVQFPLEIISYLTIGKSIPLLIAELAVGIENLVMYYTVAYFVGGLVYSLVAIGFTWIIFYALGGVTKSLNVCSVAPEACEIGKGIESYNTGRLIYMGIIFFLLVVTVLIYVGFSLFIGLI